MLLEALSALAAAGGGALVQAMATDAWQECRERTARLLGRGDPQEESRQEARLERAREELVAAGDDTEQVAARQTAAWRTRFEDLLEDAPQQAEQLRDLVAFVREQARAGGVAAGQVTVHATASGHAQQAVQGQGEQHNTFRAPR
ncbi:hypothetical protein [Streptomyces capillispiralis]|uniref:Uncharacterized protein n=1 Tax=Streptomyces capillispiralis TaxID=68182 RepID=A0A561T7M4_9ACTN|nr:hypothetical protein [Streptomyces capillispiralis]TWF83115.1 hypothetical protein FHX78_1128 [Streptomyces capillispiralis]GHH94649.1 hypothetical protein GCM10017779_51060 [Streptomyces capillispiralis]